VGVGAGAGTGVEGTDDGVRFGVRLLKALGGLLKLDLGLEGFLYVDGRGLQGYLYEAVGAFI